MKLIFAWTFIGVAFILTSLMHAWHYFDMTPEGSSIQMSSKITLYDRPTVVHILKEGCKCSNIVASKLLERQPKSGFVEWVVFVDRMNDLEQKFLAQGYQVQVWEEQEFLQENSIDGAPLILLYDSAKQLRFYGGYTEGMVTPDKPLLLSRIFESLQSDQGLQHIPTLGCAVSQGMKNRIDPFSFKDLF